LKEIELKAIKIQQNTQWCVIIMQLRISLLIKFRPSHSIESVENWFVDGLINFEELFSGLEELSFHSTEL